MVSLKWDRNRRLLTLLRNRHSNDLPDAAGTSICRGTAVADIILRAAAAGHRRDETVIDLVPYQKKPCSASGMRTIIGRGGGEI